MDLTHPRLAGGAAPTWRHEPDRLKADILACVLKFNQVTADGVNPSWLAADEVFWRDHVHAFTQPASQLRVSNWLRDRFKLNNCYDDDFQAPEKRVYLIPVQPFQHFVLCVGASFCVSTLRKQLMRPQVMSLREALGEAGVLQLFSSFQDTCDSGVTLLAPGTNLDTNTLYTLGAQALLMGAQPYGEAVFRRTQLKLRRESAEVDELLIHVRDSALLTAHMMMVAMLFLPAWNELFAQVDQEMAA